MADDPGLGDIDEGEASEFLRAAEDGDEKGLRIVLDRPEFLEIQVATLQASSSSLQATCIIKSSCCHDQELAFAALGFAMQATSRPFSSRLKGHWLLLLSYLLVIAG